MSGTRTTNLQIYSSARYHRANPTPLVYDMMMGARRVTLVQVVDVLGLSYGTVKRSLYIELKVIKRVA